MEMVSGKNQLPVSKIKTLMRLQHLSLKRKGGERKLKIKEESISRRCKGFDPPVTVNLE